MALTCCPACSIRNTLNRSRALDQEENPSKEGEERERREERGERGEERGKRPQKDSTTVLAIANVNIHMRRWASTDQWQYRQRAGLIVVLSPALLLHRPLDETRNMDREVDTAHEADT